MPEFIDQLNRKINLALPPRRIISLVPSQTELLHDLGLNEEVVGITKFCIHPGEWFSTKPKIGGTKKIKMQSVHSLRPDLIIGNKEENDQDQVNELMNHYPVWMSDVHNLDDALIMIEKTGAITDQTNNASILINKIRVLFHELNLFCASLHAKRQLEWKSHKVLYLIWQKPFMTIGYDTFIHDMLSRCGFENVFGNKSRYPELEECEISEANPDLIFLASEPYPFKQPHVEKLKSICPASRVLLVNGEYFSWYGSRLLKATDYFRSLIEQINRGD